MRARVVRARVPGTAQLEAGHGGLAKNLYATQARARSGTAFRHNRVKILSLLLVILIIAIQYPLWLGKGGWLKVWETDRQIAEQEETNRKLQVRNATLDAEVRDLKQGYEAIEERARNELGMIKEGETFFHVLEDNSRSTAR